MKKSIRSRRPYVFTVIIMLVCVFIAYHQSYAIQAYEKIDEGPSWTIHFRPGIRLGTDNRIVYTLDFLVPLYQDERHILFFSPKYSPNNRDSWEVNLGLGYRHMLIDDHLVLGVNGFYDQRKTPWGTDHNQWGVGIEIMGEVPLKNLDLGLTGRMNYYNPISSANIDMGPNGGYIYQGLGVYVVDENNIWLDEPLGGIDYELGVRVPFVSDYVETWVYGGGYHYEGDYIRNIDGFSVRAEVIPTDFLRLSYEYRDDNFYGGEHYGEIGLEIPFSIDNLIAGENPFAGIGDMLHGSRDLEERLTEPVRRDVDIIAPLLTGIDAVNALGLPLTKTTTGYVDIGDIGEYEFTISKNAITYVSEAGNDETGDGSENNPYSSIEKAYNNLKGLNALIYVLNNPNDETDTAEGGSLEDNGFQAIIFGEVIDLDSIFDMTSALDETIKIDILELYNTKIRTYMDQGDIDRFPTIGSDLYCKGSNNIIIAGLHFNIACESDTSAIYVEDYYPEKYEGKDRQVGIIGNYITIKGRGDLYGINYQREEPDDLLYSQSFFPCFIGNSINIKSDYGWVRGVYIENCEDELLRGLGVSILDNRIDVGCNMISTELPTDTGEDIFDYDYKAAYGILIKCETFEKEPLVPSIKDNTIIVNNTLGEAYGIYCLADGFFMSDIIDNDITVTSGENVSSKVWEFSENPTVSINEYYKTVGIYLLALGGSGWGAENPTVIRGNDVVVRGGNNVSSGIISIGTNVCETTLFQIDFIDNDIEVDSNNTAFGIYLKSDLVFGKEYNPVRVVFNEFDIESYENDSVGIFGHGEGEKVFIDISCNYQLDDGQKEPGIVVSGDRAYGIYLYSDWGLGTSESPVTIEQNIFEITGISEARCFHTPSFGSVDWPDEECNSFIDISNNEMSVFSDWIAVAISQSGYNLETYIDNNFMNLSSTNADAAGVLLMGYSLTGNYNNTQSITFNTPLGSAFELIDALIVEDIAALSNQIASGTTDWLYVKDADYTGFVDSIDRSLNIWGEGYQMLGYGSANYPTINETLVVTAPNTNIFGVNIDVVGECGIDVENADNLTIRSSRISVYNPLGDAYGIYFNGDVFGTEDASVIIADNEIDIISDAGNAYGVYIEGDTGSNVDIIGNDITSSITGEGNAYGIYLKGTEIGSEGVPIVLADNEIEVSCNIGNANGICVEADNYAYLDIKNNIIDAASSGYFARGVYINCIDDVDVENHINVDITGNDISVNSSGDAVGIHIYKDGFVYDVYDEISETYGYTNGVLPLYEHYSLPIDHLTMPVLNIQSSPVVSNASARQFVEALPKGELKTIEGLSHTCMWTKADEFNGLLEEFLEGYTHAE